MFRTTISEDCEKLVRLYTQFTSAVQDSYGRVMESEKAIDILMAFREEDRKIDKKKLPLGCVVRLYLSEKAALQAAQQFYGLKVD